MKRSDLWRTLQTLQQETFLTVKGLPFTITVKGNEPFISRKAKSITRATVERAFDRANEIQRNGDIVDGPKKLGTFGASYLYVLFLRLRIITRSIIAETEKA